jgi:hypothetical protein
MTKEEIDEYQYSVLVYDDESLLAMTKDVSKLRNEDSVGWQKSIFAAKDLTDVAYIAMEGDKEVFWLDGSSKPYVFVFLD